jgi:hypothetical protein
MYKEEIGEKHMQKNKNGIVKPIGRNIYGKSTKPNQTHGSSIASE